MDRIAVSGNGEFYQLDNIWFAQEEEKRCTGVKITKDSTNKVRL